jgi:predicted AAA+ superfamily ATPase
VKFGREILFSKKHSNKPQETLLFIDEILEIPHVMQQLQAFFMKKCQLNVLATGSLLEFCLRATSFPVA